jgi:transglutaminase superfamily protein
LSRLSLAEWGLVIETCATLPLASIGLAMFGWRRLKVILQRISSAESSPNEIQQRAARITNAVGRRMPIPATCLQRSVTLWWTLGRRNIDSRVVMGIRKDKSDFHAHAWVEVDGVVINDQPNLRQNFVVFDEV